MLSLWTLKKKTKTDLHVDFRKNQTPIQYFDLFGFRNETKKVD